MTRKPQNKDEQQIFDVLQEIDDLARQNGFRVFAVGGFVRDEYWGKIHSLNSDIDLISDQYHGLYLAGMLASEFKTEIEFYHRTRTAHLVINNVNLEFQSYAPDYNVLQELRNHDTPQTILSLNVFSRDFTINSILLSLRSWKIYDITNKGIYDLNNKILRCPVNPNILIPSNPLIILRALMFVNRYGFTMTSDLIEAIKLYKEELLHKLSEERLIIAYYKLINPNPIKGWKLIKQFDLLDVMPKTLMQFRGKEIPKELIDRL